MLRNRSREVACKQTRSSMTDPCSLPSPKQNQTVPISSFLGSPRFFNGFLTRTVSDVENQSSPTSILDRSFSNLNHPFGYENKNLFSLSNTTLENGKHIYEKIDGIGLALIDSLSDEKEDENINKPNSKMVLFGAKLKVQIPSTIPSSSTPFQDSSTPKSPADFGIKTCRNTQFFSSSSFKALKESPQAFSEGLSFSEMELSEEYTCVINHGPNPKTTHIFDDCIVESCCGVGNLSELKREYGLSSSIENHSEQTKFLRFCHTCNNNLGDGKDIYMYRFLPLIHPFSCFLFAKCP